MRHWSIRREPGPGSRTGRTRQVGTVDGEGQLDALQQYVYLKYLKGHRQYAGHETFYRSSRRLDSRWIPWDHDIDPHDRGREWSVVVRLRNGQSVHEVRLLAWPWTG